MKMKYCICYLDCACYNSKPLSLSNLQYLYCSRFALKDGLVYAFNDAGKEIGIFNEEIIKFISFHM